MMGDAIYCSVCGADITRAMKFYDGVIGDKKPYCYSCWKVYKAERARRLEQERRTYIYQYKKRHAKEK